MRKRFAFVNFGNSREGSVIADSLKEEGFFVYSTRQPDPKKLDHLYPDPLSVDQFIDSDISTMLSVLKTCNAIIYTILDTPKTAIELFTQLSQDSGVKKTIVIVSSVFTWAGEPKAEDWKKRWPHLRYSEFLAAERYLSSLPLKIYVMCCGLLFGNGEGSLLPLFRQAWHLEPVPIVSQLSNNIPMLHVKDMARGSVAMLQAKPTNPVIIAHDGVKPTPRDIIKAINGAFGTGKTTKRSLDDLIEVYGQEVMDWLSIDVDNEAEEFAALEFERQCAGGFIEEIQTIVDEFIQKRLLTPLRIYAVDIDPSIIDSIVEYYGVEKVDDQLIKDLFASDKSEDAVALREGHGEEEAPSLPELTKFVLGHSPLLRNHGFLIDKILKTEEERDALYLDEEEIAPFFPKYILTSKEITQSERWFVSKGAHCCIIKTFEDVQKFLGLPRNFTRENRILENRRIIEAAESERIDEVRKMIKRQKAAQEQRRLEMMNRDEELMQQVDRELASMKEVKTMNAKDYLMKYVVPMFIPPLAQINEARPDDPLRFLVSHYETESKKVNK